MNKIELLLQQVLSQCREIKEKIAAMERSAIHNQTFFTLDEFCLYCGFSKATAYKITASGKIKHYKPTGRTLRFKKSEVDEFLMSNPISPVVLSEAKSSDYLMTKRNKKHS
jgi:excisionase family DNA binding protein